MSNTGVVDNITGQYLTGWNVYGEAEFKSDIRLANRMLRNVARNVVKNLNTKCNNERYSTVLL